MIFEFDLILISYVIFLFLVWISSSFGGEGGDKAAVTAGTTGESHSKDGGSDVVGQKTS